MKITFFASLCILALTGITEAFAQDGPPPLPPAVNRVERQKPETEKRPFQSTGAVGSRLTFGHLAESPGLHVTSDIFKLLEYERIHRALGLSRDQMVKIAETKIGNIRSRQEMMRSLSGPKGPVQTPESVKERREAQGKLYALGEQRFREILKPEQLVRLQQFSLELRIQSSGTYAFLSDPQMVAELDISDSQLAKLRKSAADQSIKLDKKLMELKREIRNELTSVLDANQQLQLRSMLGKPFDWREAPDE